MLNRNLTIANLRKVLCFCGGFSVTANKSALEKYEIQALKYLLDEDIIYLDKPETSTLLPGATENDKAGRYRLNESQRAKAEALCVKFQHEINTNSRSN